MHTRRHRTIISLHYFHNTNSSPAGPTYSHKHSKLLNFWYFTTNDPANIRPISYLFYKDSFYNCNK